MNLDTVARLVATAAVTTLTALYAYYPDWHWVPAVLLAASMLGIHAIPAIGQSVAKQIMGPVPPVTITPVTHEPFTGE